MGQVSVTASPAGGVDVALGGVTIVESDDTTGTAAVPAGTFPLTFPGNPGGQLGALMTLGSSTGPIAAYQTDLDAMAQSLVDVGQRGLRRHRRELLHLRGRRDHRAAEAVAGPGDVRRHAARRHRRHGRQHPRPRVGALRGGDADDRYGAIVTRMGNEVSQASRQAATAQTLTDALQDRRDSASGVSLDEEMTNLIRFQRAYQAASRAMSTTDEMIDVLINRTGRVGL